MSSIGSSDNVINTPKSEKYKTNSLLLMMNGAFEKNMRLDVADIASILQSVGFKLHSIKKCDNNEQDNKDENELKITLHCGRSGFQAVYTKHDYVCNCQEDMNQNKEICDNSLKHTTRLARRPSNLVKELLSSIIAQKDTNETCNEVELNEEFKTPMGGEPKDNTKAAEEHLTNWEVDPKTSPPVMTSSPLAESKVETCPFCVEKEQKIAEMIEDAKNIVVKSIDQALAMLPRKNNTFTKKQFKRVSDILKIPHSPSTPLSKISSEMKSTVKRSTPKKKSPRNITDSLGTPVKKNTTPKLEKRNLLSPKRTLLKTYSPLEKRSTFIKQNQFNPSPLDRRSPLGRRNSLDTRSPLGRSPLGTKKVNQKDNPILNMLSPQVKTSKLVRTCIPKLNSVNTVSSSTGLSNSTGSLTKPKTGIPKFSKIGVQKIKY